MHLYCEDFVEAGLATGHCGSCHTEAEYYDEEGEGMGYALAEAEYQGHTAHICCPVGDIIAGMTDEDWAKVIAQAQAREREEIG